MIKSASGSQVLMSFLYFGVRGKPGDATCEELPLCLGICERGTDGLGLFSRLSNKHGAPKLARDSSRTYFGHAGHEPQQKLEKFAFRSQSAQFDMYSAVLRNGGFISIPFWLYIGPLLVGNSFRSTWMATTEIQGHECFWVRSIK